jgi:hypothetical protein
VQCWNGDVGKSVFIVDLETGKLIKQIDSSVFRSPVIGAPALYRGDPGTITTRAFVSDVDGVIWRIDFSETDPRPSDPMEGWTARPFHDFYWNEPYDAGQPSYEPPILSVDKQGRVVLIHASGDTDDFEDEAAVNRVVSITEQPPSSTTDPGPEDYKAAFNWEIILEPSELTTGPIELFNGMVLFATFVVNGNPADACDFGKSRLFAVDYLARDESRPNSTSPQTYYPVESSIGAPFNDANATDLENKLYLGVAVTKRPDCNVSTETPSTDDPYLGTRVPLPQPAEATFELVVQYSDGSNQEGSNRLKSQTYSIPTPASYTKVQSFGASCD